MRPLGLQRMELSAADVLDETILVQATFNSRSNLPTRSERHGWRPEPSNLGCPMLDLFLIPSIVLGEKSGKNQRSRCRAQRRSDPPTGGFSRHSKFRVPAYETGTRDHDPLAALDLVPIQNRWTGPFTSFGQLISNDGDFIPSVSSEVQQVHGFAIHERVIMENPLALTPPANTGGGAVRNARNSLIDVWPVKLP